MASRILGMAWYRPEQWEKLREVSVDAADIAPRWEDWSRIVTRRFERMQSHGKRVRKVDVDVGELTRWCKARGVPVDLRSRTQFVSEKLGEDTKH